MPKVMPEWSQIQPKWIKMAPTRAPGGLQMSQEASWWQQETPTWPQGGSRSSQDVQDGSRGPQASPKMASEGSNMSQGRPQEFPMRTKRGACQNDLTKQNRAFAKTLFSIVFTMKMTFGEVQNGINVDGFCQLDRFWIGLHRFWMTLMALSVFE